MSKTETRTVKMTPADIVKAETERDEAYAHIGAIAVAKAKANAEASAQTKFQTKIVDRLVANLEAGEHEVVCRIRFDLYDDKAHFVRQDTGEWVSCRPLTEEERQQPLNFDTSWSAVPEDRGASAAAKKKSPGLKEQEATETQLHVAKELHDNFGPVLAGEVVGRTAIVGAAAALQWGIEEKLRRDEAARNPPVSPASPPVADVPDEVRAAVLEANVPADMVEVAIAAIRDGAKPEVVIANATRGSKAEKETKPKKEKKAKPTPEEQARLDLLKELRGKLGQDIGTDAAFAVVDGRMDRAQAVQLGEELKATFDADNEFDGHHTAILEDVFVELLTIDEAIHNARLRTARLAEARA